MMRRIDIIIIFLSSGMVFSTFATSELRKPLKPAVQETVGAIRETVHGALGVVQFKDDQHNQKEFDSSLRELATGIANLILAGIHQKQNSEQYRTKEEVNELIEELVALVTSQIKDLSL
ncbi:MAG TPA: hypothetical protein VL201_00490 [Patescibacteria group bacterium]|jgi:hypothetical protein|nr:hypothetical protein [Patescibacteria group bacterium]